MSQESFHSGFRCGEPGEKTCVKNLFKAYNVQLQPRTEFFPENVFSWDSVRI